MKPLRNSLEQICTSAFETCGFDASFGALQEADRPDLADFQCNGALAVAKKERRNPREVATQIVESLEASDQFTVDIAGPGFLNFRVSDTALAGHADALRDGASDFLPKTTEPKNFLVDYGGPNIAKEMHVGHLRASIIGQALKDILLFVGHKAEGDIHMGDWGLQMGQLIAYAEDQFPALLSLDDETPITMQDLQDWYPEASKLSKTDDAFRERSRLATNQLQALHPPYYRFWERICDVSKESLERDFKWLGVEFEYWYGESRYQAALDPLVDACLEKGHAVEDNDAIVIQMPNPDKLPPLIMRNSNGSYGYGATDIATLSERISDPELHTILYVVDARQAMHFQQVFNAARTIGLLDKVGAEHIAFGTVNGTNGKPFKTREGGTMRLVDLIGTMTARARARLDEADTLPMDIRDTVAEQIARAAIKFGELSHDRERNYVFDIEQFLKFEGKTGPYLQYTGVRIRSLIENAEKAEIKAGQVTDIGQSGRELILTLDALPLVFERTIGARKPSYLANHLYRLADGCNKFYQQNRIMHETVSPEQAASWLSVLMAAQGQLSLCMDVLGLDMPEQM